MKIVCKLSISRWRRPFLWLLLIAAAACGGQPPADATWAKYCSVDRYEIDKGLASLAEPLVAKALEKIDALPETAQVLIPARQRRSYKFARSSSKQYLDTLCGEYRDDGARLEAKLKLLSNLVIVPEDRIQRFDPTQDPIAQLTADGVRNLILISHNLRKFRGSDSSPAAAAIEPAMSPCELKFLFKNYLSRYRTVLNYDDSVQYVRELAAYLKDAAASGECSPDDLNYMYAFRGSGYISPTDPESAAMKQTDAALRDRCDSSGAAGSWLSDTPQICGEYRASPHGARRRISLQLLRRLATGSGLDQETLEHRFLPLILTEDTTGDGVGEAIAARSTDEAVTTAAAVFGGKLYSSYIGGSAGSAAPPKLPDPRRVAIDRFSNLRQGLEDKVFALVTNGAWRPEFAAASDLGLAELNDIKTDSGRSRVRNRIGAILDRHAFYYQTFFYFGSLNSLFPSVTPFLSTSGDLVQAAKFSFGGFAVGKIRAPKLGWIYVFRFDGSRLFDAAATKSGRRVEWERDWLDESTLASNKLAVEENGLDRFSEPAPEELYGLLYLGNCRIPAELLVLAQSEGSAAEKSDAGSRSND